MAGQTMNGKITVITPTGDRPECFALLRRWMAQQTRKPDQWIVVDDGMVPYEAIPEATIIRREPQENDPPCTLGPNLEVACAHVIHDKVIIMEDDDWYGPEYIETLANLLNVRDLVGVWGTKYYDPEIPGYRELGRKDHAAMSQTGMRKSFLPQLLKSIPPDGHTPDVSIDLRLWWNNSLGRSLLTPGAGKRLHVSIKAMPGRPGAGIGHDKQNFIPDAGYEVFKTWCDDWEVYRDFPRPDRDRIVIYTALAGSGRDSLQDPTPIPGVDYVCFTDQPLTSKVWDIRPFRWTHQEAVRTAKHPKVLPHEYFPDHEVSIWVDANITPGPDLLRAIREYLTGPVIAVHKHPFRMCLYREAEVVIQYLKDKPELIERTILKYLMEKVPHNGGLYECGILFRRHRHSRVKEAMNRWWEEISIGTQSDQINFAYVVWKTHLPLRVINGNLRQNPYFKFTPHEDIFWGKISQ
jgi:hypothetical protein